MDRPRYWAAERKIAIVLLNPGSGEGRADDADLRMREKLTAFRERQLPIADILQHQRDDLRNWGRGRFWSYFASGLGLNVDRTALANVAWCATSGNSYPAPMLNQCFEKHTGR